MVDHNIVTTIIIILVGVNRMLQSALNYKVKAGKKTLTQIIVSSFPLKHLVGAT